MERYKQRRREEIDKQKWETDSTGKRQTHGGGRKKINLGKERKETNLRNGNK
jgi:hypothetical protein